MTGTNGSEPDAIDIARLEQIKLIIETVDGVVPFPEDWETTGEDVEYLYRANKLVVRDSSLRRVMEYLSTGRNQEDDSRPSVGNHVDRADPVLSGATVLTLDDGWDVRFDLLREVEEREGHGVMDFDYLFYVCRTIHSCAAIEPEEVAGDATPVPAPQFSSPPLSKHGAGVDVLVLDTGLVEGAAGDHDWMTGVVGDPDSLIQAGQPIPQDGGHGTFTAGCVRITAPEAGVRVVNAIAPPPGRLDVSNQASGQASSQVGAAWGSGIAAHLRSQLVADEGGEPIPVPDVIVMNFAGTTDSGRPPVTFATLYENIIQHLNEPLILAPAGNEGDTRKNWPASFEWVVSVGALTEDDQLAEFSNRGRSVDVYARGDGLVNAYAEGQYTTRWDPQNPETRTFDGMALWSGTSFSTPLVAGLVAARMSSTGQTSRRAWHSLLEVAEQQVVTGAGPSLYPGQELD